MIKYTIFEHKEFINQLYNRFFKSVDDEHYKIFKERFYKNIISVDIKLMTLNWIQIYITQSDGRMNNVDIPIIDWYMFLRDNEYAKYYDVEEVDTSPEVDIL